MSHDAEPTNSDTTAVADGSPAARQVTLRYWAAIRAAAGAGAEAYDIAPGNIAPGGPDCGTLADLLAAARERHADDPRFSAVLAMCALLVGDRPVGRTPHDEVLLPPGAVVDALPPFAGG